MKKIKPLTLVIVSFFFMASCETDDIESKKLDSSLFWVSFVEPGISSSENTSVAITSKVSLSATTQETDVAVKYTVSSPDDAVEGVDYTLPEGFGSAVIPAGEHFVDVELATLINDDIIEGDKTLIFTIESAENFNVGLPDNQEGNSYTLTIKEDDFFTLIAGTSFEEPLVEGEYIDTQNNDVDHDMVNNASQDKVDFTSTGGEMGFDATYIFTRQFNTPRASNAIGVVNDVSDVVAYTDGSQGYKLTDVEGTAKVVFDNVDITRFTSVSIDVDLFIKPSPLSSGTDTYEETDQNGTITADRVRLYVIVDGGVELDIVNEDSYGNLNAIASGVWETKTLDLTNYTNVQLVFEVDTNVPSEGAYIDNVKIKGSN